jgi:hypothetical protein
MFRSGGRVPNRVFRRGSGFCPGASVMITTFGRFSAKKMTNFSKIDCIKLLNFVSKSPIFMTKMFFFFFLNHNIDPKYVLLTRASFVSEDLQIINMFNRIIIVPTEKYNFK